MSKAKAEELGLTWLAEIGASGQVAGLIDDLPSCAELVDRIMTEAQVTLRMKTPACWAR